MNNALQEMKDWGKLVAAVLTSTPPAATDAICIFNRNDLQLELLDRAASLYRQMLPTAPRIVINGLEKYEAIDGTWGCPEWTAVLREHGVPAEHLIAVKSAGHTGEEAERFVALSREHGWRNVGVMAPPYYLPRCFLNMLGVSTEQGVELSLPCLTLPSIQWEKCATKHAVRGGTIVKGARFDHLDDELERILRYRAKYQEREPGISAIASISQGVDYFRKQLT